MATIILGDIIEVIKETVNPKTCGYDKFVGLEHYDAGEPMITRYGSPENLDTNVKHFCKGDILVARRNVYLKRAGYVDFEGVTSGDSIVLRVKDKSYLRILPFILNTDDFWDYAEQNSDGTMSKRLSPDDLMDYEFEEPENMDELADKLWAAYRVKESYRKLLAATDDMVKAKFVEMFGDPMSSAQKYEIKSLGECCTINPRRFAVSLLDTDKVSFVPMPAVSENGYIDGASDVDYGTVKKGFTYFENGDVLFAKITPCMENGKGAIAQNLTNGVGMGSTEFHILRPINGVSNEYWLLCLTRLPQFRAKARKNMTGTGGQLRVSSTFLTDFPIGLPPIAVQEQFASVFTQAEATKASLRQSIESIDRVIKSLINQ